MFCCGEKFKPKRIQKHQLAFMGIVEDGVYGKPEILDDILAAAKKEGQENQIFDAVDED